MSTYAARPYGFIIRRPSYLWSHALQKVRSSRAGHPAAFALAGTCIVALLFLLGVRIAPNGADPHIGEAPEIGHPAAASTTVKPTVPKGPYSVHRKIPVRQQVQLRRSD